MQLEGKPDFEQAKQRWAAYWAGEVLGRPPVVASVRRNGPVPNRRDRSYHNAVTHNYPAQLDIIDEWLAGTLFLAEAIPFSSPDHGPDQFGAFLGTQLCHSEDSGNTNWVEPFVEDWRAVLPLKLDEQNPVWQSVLEYSAVLARHARGRYLVGVCDWHSNADALSAIRGPERLCMDFYDCPELVEQAMQDVRRLYAPVYDAVYKACGMNAETGSIGWTPFWCEGRFATIQCDFICMVSPAIFRKYILPALEEEATFLDHCVYHLDGPGALVHLDDILAIDRVDVIQWVSGAGQKEMYLWTDVLKRCQKAGKGLQLYGPADAMKRLHKELEPKGVMYCPGGLRTREQVDEFCGWLERNT